MNFYNTKDIRNVALLGHGSCGKTTLAEAMAYKTKLIDRMGRVEDKSTVSDFDAEEQNRTISISTALLPLEYNKHKINLLDTPGYFDFVGEQLCALRAADAAIIVVDALSGVEVGTEKAWNMVSEAGIPAIFVVNKADRENVEFARAYESIKSLIGNKAAAFTIPVNEGVGFNTITSVLTGESFKYDKGASSACDTPADTADAVEGYMEELMETAASADEELMEKYLEGEELSVKEIHAGCKQAILNDEMVPVLTVSANGLVGIDKLLDTIIDVLPSPADAHVNKCDPAAQSAAFIFKTIADPYVGKLSIFKVIGGEMPNTIELINTTTGKKEKITHLYTMAGKKQIEIEKLACGDIGAFSKLADSVTNQILSADGTWEDAVLIDFPKANISMAISPKSKGDEDKMGTGITRIKEEDPTIVFERNAETNQNLISGMGEMHIDVVASKLKSKYGVDVELDIPLIPYRETIKKKAENIEGKHKKQSGGSGQFGVVIITFEPSYNQEVQLEFVDQVVGGTVPRQYIPAVEKGLNQCVAEGVLAGYPVVGLKATLLDGKYHPVDSDEISFITAARLAYKDGMPKADPVLLEPIYSVEITVPNAYLNEYMGSIMGDMSKKRGRVMGQDSVKPGYTAINAEAPYGEMLKYATELRSMTQGRGSFTMKFERYEEVPAMYAGKIIEEAKKRKEEKK